MSICIFCVYLAYFMPMRSILCPLGVFCINLAYFISILLILCLFGLFHAHKVYLASIGRILCQFSLFCVHLACVMLLLLVYDTIEPHLSFCTWKISASFFHIYAFQSNYGIHRMHHYYNVPIQHL